MPKRAQSSLDEAALARVLRDQDGVVSRRQLVAAGASRTDLRRMLARRDLHVVHPGVYVDHSGRPTRRQREWAAVLLCEPAALHRESALEAHGMSRDRGELASGGVIHLLVARDRRIDPPAGIVVERVGGHLDWIQENRRPPRAVVEFALLKAAADRDLVGAVALLADAVHQGITTPPRVLDTLEQLPRLRQRAVLAEILADVAAGTRSVLERRYLRDVERAHGLPVGERQIRESSRSGVVARDVRYVAERTVVELDGAFGHRDSADRWRDLQRDLDAAVSDLVTLRPGWAQVLEPCRLAGIVAVVLQRRGWTKRPRSCGAACMIADCGGSGPT
jgi:hypothetical protein